MGMIYATIEDIQTLIRPLTTQERNKADALLPIASSKLRLTASKYGTDLDALVETEPDYANTTREIVCKAVVRALDASSQSSTASVVSQESQSALGYTASMTYLNAGQSLYYLKNELRELGLRKQKYGALDIYGIEVEEP